MKQTWIPIQKKRSFKQEKVDSSWLTVLPIEEHGFTLTKNEFRDAILLRYNKVLTGMPSQFPCGQNYDVTHAMNCKKGVFIIMRHNNVRGFEVNLLKTTLNNVEIEPKLQKIDNEGLNGLAGDDARPDMRARGVWKHIQMLSLTYKYVRSQKHLPVSADDDQEDVY